MEEWCPRWEGGRSRIADGKIIAYRIAQRKQFLRCTIMVEYPYNCLPAIANAYILSRSERS